MASAIDDDTDSNTIVVNPYFGIFYLPKYNYRITVELYSRKRWRIQLFGLLGVQNFGKFSSPQDLKDKDRIF